LLIDQLINRSRCVVDRAVLLDANIGGRSR
jgi:hypothetical protein